MSSAPRPRAALLAVIALAILGVWMLLNGLLLFTIGALLAAFGAGLLTVVGILLLAFGIASFAMLYGVWKTKPWARRGILVLSGVAIFADLVYVATSSLTGMIVWGVALVYLIRREDVQAYLAAGQAKPMVSGPDCPKCGMPLTYIEQYQRFYCYNCKEYPRIEEIGKVPLAEKEVEKPELGVALCQSCGSSLEPGVRFCGSCGSEIQPVKRLRFCTRCGAELKGDLNVCSSCGAKVSEM